MTNYACMISPADFVGCPAKVRWLTMFFLKKKSIFVRLLGWPVGWHTRIHLYVTLAVQKFLILHRNVPFFMRTLNLIFSEKHICRFAPLVLSFLEWHLWQAAPPGDKYLTPPHQGWDCYYLQI